MPLQNNADQEFFRKLWRPAVLTSVSFYGTAEELAEKCVFDWRAFAGAKARNHKMSSLAARLEVVPCYKARLLQIFQQAVKPGLFKTMPIRSLFASWGDRRYSLRLRSTARLKSLLKNAFSTGEPLQGLKPGIIK